MLAILIRAMYLAPVVLQSWFSLEVFKTHITAEGEDQTVPENKLGLVPENKTKSASKKIRLTVCTGEPLMPDPL